jgi:hypothetical protein
MLVMDHVIRKGYEQIALGFDAFVNHDLPAIDIDCCDRSQLRPLLQREPGVLKNTGSLCKLRL